MPGADPSAQYRAALAEFLAAPAALADSLLAADRTRAAAVEAAVESTRRILADLDSAERALDERAARLLQTPLSLDASRARGGAVDDQAGFAAAQGAERAAAARLDRAITMLESAQRAHARATRHSSAVDGEDAAKALEARQKALAARRERERLNAAEEERRENERRAREAAARRRRRRTVLASAATGLALVLALVVFTALAQ